MSQCAKTLSLATILTNISLQFQTNLNNGKLTLKKSSVINEQLFYLQNFITECERLNITELEYAYLKLISIFDSGKSKNIFIFKTITNLIIFLLHRFP